MMQGDAHFDAAIFEWVDVQHFRNGADFDVPVRPDIHQQFEMPQRQPSERGRGILREDDDFAQALCRLGRHPQCRRVVRRLRQRWKQIFEDRHIPRAGGHFGRRRRIRRDRERVVFFGRQERAVLAMSGVCDPFTTQRMPPQVRVRRCAAGAARTRRRQPLRDRLAPVEQQFAPVRLRQPAFVQAIVAAHRSSTGSS